MRFLQLLLLFTFGFLHAQEEAVHSVYFDFDKSNLDEKHGEELVNFVKKIDSTRIESIEIFGYTDDIGKEAYNFKLSTKRATVIQEKMIESGIKNKIIDCLSGTGRIRIDAVMSITV